MSRSTARRSIAGSTRRATSCPGSATPAIANSGPATRADWDAVGSAGSFGAHAAHRRAVPLVALAWLLVGALSAGCAVELERPTAPPEPTLADATAEAVNEEAALEWIAFREQYELRSDRAWVLSVAGNPLSVNDTGIPLLPYELV